MKSLDVGCYIVSINKDELTEEENLENLVLLKQELEDLLIPYTVGEVGVGSTMLSKEPVFIIPMSHDHMVDSIVKVYNQTSYLLCHPDRHVEVISLLPSGKKSTPLGTMIGTRVIESNQTNLLVNGVNYVIESN